MSSLNIELAVWNAATDPTHTKVTATATHKDGIACGHSDGKVWLYEFASAKLSEPATPTELKMHPKCMLVAHQSPIVLLKIAHVNSPLANGTEGALISVSEDGNVVLWDISDGRCISRVRTPLQNIRPASINLQTVDYQSAAEDLLFVTGEGHVAYVLSYPSLELVHEWHLPHSEWITAQMVRKRKDHFRSELITCTSDGVVRIWGYDEFVLSQQDVFSRAASPTMASFTDMAGLGASLPRSRSESVISDAGTEVIGASSSSHFHLESTFASLGEEHAILQLVINPFNEDEFLAVSPSIVRLFASRNNELHELLRWKTQRSNSAAFIGAGFLAESDIIFWDALGNISSVCSLFTVEGGSAGMHLTRGLHAEKTGESPVFVAASLDTVTAGPESGIGLTTGRPGSPVHVLSTYTSNRNTHSLSVVFPMPLSSVSGSANRPHVAIADSKVRAKNWLGSSIYFAMNGLWSEWMDGLKPEQDTTSALVTCSGKVALGLESGKLRIVPPTLLVASSRTDCDVSNTAPTGELDFCGHSSAITALFEWTVPALGNCVCCGRCPSDDDYNSHSQLNDTQVTSACSHSLLVSASKDLTMKVWDMATGKCLCTLPTQSAPVVHMCPVLPPAKYASWRQTSERHNAMASVLGSLLLAIASDNSTTLVSMDSLERVHVTPPCHEQPVRLSLRRDTGDLVILYSDDSQRCVVLSQLLGPVSKGAADKPAGSLPSISVSLVSGPPRPASESGADSSSQGWANVQMVSAYNNSRKLRVRNIGGGGGGPVALLMDVELMQLYSAVSKLVPEGTDLKDIQQLLSDEAAGDLTGSGSKGALQPIHASYMLMSVLCTWGISKDLDDIKQTAFMIRPPRLNVSLTFSNKHDDVHTVMFPNSQNRGHDWCVSSFLNAQRMMAILVLSGTILQGNEKRAVEVINFYVGKLQAEVGPRFKNLSLLTLAQYWQSPNANLQRAARTLILSAIHSAPEKLRRAELFYWSSVLARCAPGGVDTEDLYALTIVCIIGSDYPSLLPLTARSMAASMLQALISADRVNVRARMVAVELLSRGFPTFKAYLDCQLIIRRLLGIMMSVSEDGHDKSTMQMSAAAAALGVRAGSAGPATAGMGLGIRRVMSGVSMPASGEFGSSDIGSRRPSYSRVHNSSEDPAAAALAAGTGPKAIPKPSGASRTNGSLASTPNNAMSSIARVAITSSAMRAQMKFPQLPPALSTDDDATHYSSDHGNSNASSDDCQGHRHRYHAHRPSRSQRSSSGNGALGVGNTVSFNLVVLAKTALLRISVSDITLINNTVVNILQTSESIRERRGALQLVGLVAQKHPGLLYPFLEGLVATIVQAIEPKHATSRKLLIGAAGAALQGLVRAYPWVSFHPESQCLAVGCIDGRCTAYDLRTATRTAVYDTQAAAPVVAVAISPQGDRVGSFTLGDGVLSIWDPSPSALAMFARSLFWSAIDGGAVPGSSSGTVTPIKTMQIPGAFLSRAEELPISSMMEVAKLTWTADRTLLLQIHDASFSLSL